MYYTITFTEEDRVHGFMEWTDMLEMLLECFLNQRQKHKESHMIKKYDLNNEHPRINDMHNDFVKALDLLKINKVRKSVKKVNQSQEKPKPETSQENSQDLFL